MNPKQFMKTLTSLHFENTFNPYVDRCKIHDLENAPKLRRDAIFSMLKVAADSEIDAIWIGRDLGYRGGRRTGLALTDDVHMQAHAQRWGISITRPTKGEFVAERTAAVIWGILGKINARIFLWNVFPLHPHLDADPFSNRSHNIRERDAGEELLFSLIELLKPNRIIAIGNDAANAAVRVATSADIIQVRHPSYGGQTQFLNAMRELYHLPNSGLQNTLF